MNSPSPCAVILFAKDPVPGKVKTRLQTLWDPETTCQFYSHILKDSIDKIGRLDHVDRFVGVYPLPDSGIFKDAEFLKNWTVFEQEGEDLGIRMKNAFQRRLDDGYAKVAILGSDSPTVPASYIEQAIQSERDVVLGPSIDGGYYLIAMKEKVAPVFEGVDWGTGRVLEQTLERLRDAGIQPEILPVWYDVDLPEDVRYLKTHLEALQLAGQNPYSETLKFLQVTHLNPKS